MTEGEIAAHYQRHGHPLFRLCLALRPMASEARELLHASFSEMVRGKSPFVRVSFEQLRRVALKLAGVTEVPGDAQDVRLARYLADDLSARARGDLEEELAGNQSAQVRLAVMRSERAAFYSATTPEVFAQTVQATVAARGGRRPATWRFAATGIALLSLGGIAIAAWQLGLPARQALVNAPIHSDPNHSDAAQIDASAAPATNKPVENAVPALAPTPPDIPSPSAPARVQEPAKAASAPAEGARDASPPSEGQPAPSPPTAAAANGSASSQPGGERMMATFDFGEDLGRISIYEGRSRHIDVPTDTALQVRANIPEPGHAAVLSFDAETGALAARTKVVPVSPRWRVLGRFTIDRAQTLYLVFSPRPFSLPQLLAEGSEAARQRSPLPIERQARLDVSIAPATP